MSEIIYGTNVIKTAIECKIPFEELVVTDMNQEIIHMAMERRIPFRLVSKSELDKTMKNHQGAVATIAKFPTYSVENIASGNENSLIVVLDSLEDPHNLGAILRTCDAAGCDGVIFPKNRSVRLNATVAKVSTGAIFSVKSAETVNVVSTLKKLKERGYWIVGAEYTEKSVDYDTMKYDMPTVLVIGSEGKGISRLVREHCDFLVKIPMQGVVNSLNASVSAGILIYRIKKDQK